MRTKTTKHQTQTIAMSQETQHMVDNLNSYQRWQIDRYGNIVTSAGELLTMEEELAQEKLREEEKINAYYEDQMNDHWNY